MHSSNQFWFNWHSVGPEIWVVTFKMFDFSLINSIHDVLRNISNSSHRMPLRSLLPHSFYFEIYSKRLFICCVHHYSLLRDRNSILVFFSSFTNEDEYFRFQSKVFINYIIYTLTNFKNSKSAKGKWEI